MSTIFPFDTFYSYNNDNTYDPLYPNTYEQINSTQNNLNFYRKYKLYKALSDLKHSPVLDESTRLCTAYTFNFPGTSCYVHRKFINMNLDQIVNYAYTLNIKSTGAYNHIPENYQTDGKFAKRVFDLIHKKFLQSEQTK